MGQGTAGPLVTRPVRWPMAAGGIPAGAVGPRAARARRPPGAELAGVADIDGVAAGRAASLSPGALATTDHRALLADPSVQAVVIASPNDTHAALVREAARAGKHVFCEKPIALDLPSADAALAEAARQGVKLQIGFQRRFDPAYREARQAIADGELGAVELIVGTTRDPSPPGGGE